ncbi:hypothetical protein HDE_06135 [Halotydeus destructor]|nr:hypothetical protein HDE_06135 [Halotydeus destructor]
MDAGSTFAAIDLLLMLNGGKIFITHHLQSILNYSFRCFVLCSMTLVLIKMVSEQRNMKTVAWIRTFSDLPIPLIVYTFLIWRSTSIRQLLEDILQSATLKTKYVLRRYSVICFTIHIIFMTIDATMKIHWYCNLDRKHLANPVDHATILAVVFLDIVLMRRSYFIAASIYAIALQAWYLSLKDNLMTKSILTSLDDPACQCLLSMKNRFDGLKKRFNDRFAIFLLLLFSAMFLESSGLLIVLRFEELTTNVSRLALHALRLLQLVAVMTLIIKVQAQELKLYKQLIHNWRSRLVEVSRDTREILQETFTPSEPLDAILFTIDKSLVLNFGASLMSFTVMVIQFK